MNGVNFTGAAEFKFALVGTGDQTFWSNDGTSTGASEPVASVPVSVQDGLFTVHLGDTNLANMMAIPATVFTNPAVSLRLWFDDGVNGLEQLSPDQPLGAVGYARRAALADQVPWSGITDVPPDFADAVDNDTAYSAGTGLGLTGTTFSVVNGGAETAQH